MKRALCTATTALLAAAFLGISAPAAIAAPTPVKDEAIVIPNFAGTKYWKVDPVSLEVTEFAAADKGSSYYVAGYEINQTTGTAYVPSYVNGGLTSTFTSVDFASGKGTTLASSSADRGSTASAYDGTTLWSAIDSDQGGSELYTIDTTTGAYTSVAQVTLDGRSQRLAALASWNGTLYAMPFGGGNVLYTVNKQTGALSRLVAASGDVYGSAYSMDFDSSGRLWMWNMSSIGWMNIETGVITVAGAISVPGGASEAMAIGNPLIAAPSVTTEPLDQAVAVGGEATFSVAAAGRPTPDLQWQASVDGETWTDMPGETGASLTLEGIPLDANGMQYRAAASNSEGTVYSKAATLNVGELPVATGYWPSWHVSAGYEFEMIPEATGYGSISFSITEGELPEGLELDEKTGAVTGTLSEPGEWSFVVSVNSAIGSTTYPVTIVANEPSPWAQVLFHNEFTKGANVADGLMVLAEGGDLKPGSEWTFELFSDPVTLGSGVVPGITSGVGGEFTLPTDLAAGSYRLVFTGTGFSGEAVLAEAWFGVDAAGVVYDVSYEGPVTVPVAVAVPIPVDLDDANADALANTGAEALPVVAGGALALLLGAAFLVVARLRRRSA